MPPKQRMERLRLLFDHHAWFEHQFLSCMRDSRKAGSLWGMMRGVGGVRKSIDQSWLAKGLGLGLLCWGFKGVQQEILREAASTLEIGSVAFPPGQYTSPQLHPCHRLFDQDGHQHSYRILLHIILLKCSHIQIAILKFTSCDNQALVGCIPIAAVAVHLNLKSYKLVSRLIRCIAITYCIFKSLRQF